MYNSFKHRDYYNATWCSYCPIYQQIVQNYERNYDSYLRYVQESPLVQGPIITPDDASSDEYRQEAPVILANFWANKNSNFRRRCGCDAFGSCPSTNFGTSYAAVDYNFGVGPGKYKIKVWIKHYGKEYYGSRPTFEERWRLFQRAPKSYNHFSTAILPGPGAPGRAGYFQNGNNNTPHSPYRNTGTLGLEVYDKVTNKSIWRALYYFEEGFGDWGREWLRCGHDYGFQFRDR